MIEFVQGDILQSDAQMIVIPVNCVGVMGKGLALQAKQKWPELNNDYRQLCKDKKLKPGDIWLWKSGDADIETGPTIACVATKDHWRDPSQLRWVTTSVKVLERICHFGDVETVAIPMLGCGNGGLEWKSVLPVIRAYFDCAIFQEEDKIKALVYGPDV